MDKVQTVDQKLFTIGPYPEKDTPHNIGEEQQFWRKILPK